MKQSLISAFFMILSFSSFAQLVKADPDELAAMMKRTLIVEVREEDPEIIASLEKSIKKKPENAEHLTNYKAAVRTFNADLKAGVDKFWTINPKIEYKTSTEIKKLKAAKNSQYVCLTYSESGDHGGGFSVNPSTGEVRNQYTSPLTIPTLNYIRSESKKTDYSFYMPYDITSHSPTVVDFVFSVRFIQAHIAYILEKKKSMTAKEYAEECGEENCKMLKEKTLIINGSRLTDNASQKTIKENYSAPFKLAAYTDIEDAIMKSDGNSACLIAIPYDLKVSRGSSGTGVSLGSSKIYYMRVAVDTKTFAVLGCHGTKAFQRITIESGPKDFKEFSECK